MRIDERSGPAPELALPLRSDILPRLQGESVAVMLYGSRARGDARPESDVDVLQLVEHSPRSYSIGELNVTSYTSRHLSELARRGSLFVRHLRADGIVLEDPWNKLAAALAAYREPSSYVALRTELAVVASALRLPGAELYPRGSRRAASFVVRSLLYAACADAGRSEFDVVRASEWIGRRQVGIDLRSEESTTTDLLEHADWLRTYAGVREARLLAQEFEEAVVWAGASNPSAGALLEAVLADSAEIDYTSLTLPIS